MFTMNGSAKPTDLSEFCTYAYAARILGVSYNTIRRMVDKGVLTPITPAHVPDETPPRLLSRQQVGHVHTARRMLGHSGSP